MKNLALLLASASAFETLTEVDYLYMDYVTRFGKSYGTRAEFEFRKQIFAKTQKTVEEWNRRKEATHELGHNEFSDMTADERKRKLGFRPISEAEMNENVSENLEVANIPASVNWLTAGAVNPVQDQGQCGSCWAFSAIGAIEGAHYVAKKKLVKLSEQQCLDCSSAAHGCRGGWQKDCYAYAETAEILTEAHYPYAQIADSCMPFWPGVVEVKSFGIVPKNSKSQLMARIAQQPTAVTIEADQPVFQQYTSGIISSSDCGTSLDHAVLAVGYGTENGQDYYLVKNSWGATWGENGYVRIAATEDGEGICGIQMYASYVATD